MENKILRVVVIIALVFLASTAAVLAQPPEPAENRLFEQVYLAKDNGAGQAGRPRDAFFADRYTDTLCSCFEQRLAGDGKNGTRRCECKGC